MTPTLLLVAILLALVLLFVLAKFVQMRRVEFIREFKLPGGCGGGGD